MLKVHAKNLGTVAVLSLQGHIVIGETEILRNSVDSLSETSAVVLDLARVSTVDAHGLGVLLELREQLGARGVRLELMNVSQPMCRILEITRLDTVFRITPGAEFFRSVARTQRASLAALRSCA